MKKQWLQMVAMLALVAGAAMLGACSTTPSDESAPAPTTEPAPPPAATPASDGSTAPPPEASPATP